MKDPDLRTYSQIVLHPYRSTAPGMVNGRAPGPGGLLNLPGVYPYNLIVQQDGRTRPEGPWSTGGME